MRLNAGIIFTFILNALSASNYYVSSSSGDDTNTGKSLSQPWKSISKVNAMMETFVPDDTVFFKCGDTFTEQLNITKSGTYTSPIVFTSYGSGAKPLINTAVKVSDWTLTSKPNIWVANYKGSLSDIRFVTINGSVQQIGRYPDITDANDGFLYNDECWGYNKLRDADLNKSTQNWVGAYCVNYTRPYYIEFVPIQNHEKDTLTFAKPTKNLITKGYGYFIQNHFATLSVQGEWYFDKVEKKIYLFSTFNPTSVKVEASSTSFGVLFSNGVNGVNVRNMAFTNIDSIALHIRNCNYIHVYNCDFFNCLYGIWATPSQNISITNCSFRDIYNISIGSNSISSNFTITGNKIKRNAMVPGMGDNDANGGIYKAGISVYCTNANVSYNLIDSCGYHGIHFNGWGNKIIHNQIGYFNMKQFDGAGIYSFGTWSVVPGAGYYKYGNNLIENNYIHNGIGYLLGTNARDAVNRRPGIYCDALTENNLIHKNILYNTNGILLNSGSHHHTVVDNTIYNSDAFNTLHPDISSINVLQGSAYHTITNNTLYNATVKINFNPYSGFNVGRSRDTIPPMNNHGFVFRNNIVFSSKNTSQPPVSFSYGFKNYPQYFGIIDSNYYWQPFALDSIVASVADSGYVKTRRLAYGINEWKKSFEPHSVFKFSEFPAKFSDIQQNLFASNSTFDKSTADWDYDSENVTSPGGWISSGGLDEGCALLDLSTANTSKSKLSGVRFYRMIGTVEKGDVYILNFSTISNSDAALLCINYSSTIGTNPKTYITSTKRKEYSIPITFNDNFSGAKQYIYFTLHDKGVKVWLDNITLRKVTVDQALPSTVIRFDVNPTVNPMQIILGASSYKDVYGTIYSGTYTLEPFSSKILQYYVLSDVSQTADNQHNIKLLVYPTTNSGAESLRLNIHSPVSENINIRIVSINGQVIFNHYIQVNEGQTTVNLPKLKKGVYLVESLSSKGKKSVTKFIL